MHEAPSHQCVSCSYPIADAAATASCPECGADRGSFYPVNQLPLSLAVYASLWLYSISLIILGLVTLAALARIESGVLGLQDSVRLTYYGWWTAALPASGALIGVWLGTRAGPKTLSRLWMAAGLLAWLAVSIGLILHHGSHELIAVGLALSGLAPVAILLLHTVPMVACRQMRRRVYPGFIISAQAIAAFGMACYVGITTVLYFDYSEGLGLYLGSRNFGWVELFFGGGLFLFLASVIIALVLALKLLVEHHERRDATTSPSC